MALFKKQNKDIPAAKKISSEVDSALARQIHVMPERFYVAPKRSHTGLIIIIASGIVLIGGLVAAAVYLNENLKNSAVSLSNVSTPVVVNTQPLTNQTSNVNIENTNAAISTTTPTSTTPTTVTSTPTSTGPLVNNNTNTTPPINQVASLQPFPSSLDSDNDGLTDVEESLYGTNPLRPDSNGNGYPDGTELLNGYDPIQKGMRLTQTHLFTTYTAPTFSIMYPSSWKVQENGTNKDDVEFIAASGEFVEVMTIANPDRKSLVDWYKAQYPSIDMSTVTSVSVNNVIGLRHPNYLSYYVVKSNDSSIIYFLNYSVGNRTQANFMTTFAVMAKSFKALP